MELNDGQSPEDSLRALLRSREAVSHLEMNAHLACLGFKEALAIVHESLSSDDCVVSQLDFSHSQLEVDGAVVLAAVAACNRSIKILDLRNNGLRTKGVTELITGILRNDESGIETLVLSGNGLDAASNSLVKSLVSGRAQGQAQARALIHLDLSDNDLGENIAMYMSECVRDGEFALKTLILDRCAIGPKGMAALLNSLSLALDPNEAEAGLESNWKPKIQLETLSLVGNCNRVGADDEVFSMVSKPLVDLVNRNAVLRRFDLSDNFIGDEAVKLLAQALCGNTVLVSLGVARTHHHEGVVALCQALKYHNRTLSEIDLSGNVLGVVESYWIADLVTSSTTCQRIIVNGHQWTDREAMQRIHDGRAVALNRKIEIVGITDSKGFLNGLARLSRDIGDQVWSLFAKK